MTKPMVRIYDIATNEVIDREMTDEEFAAYEADKTEPTVEETENV